MSRPTQQPSALSQVNRSTATKLRSVMKATAQTRGRREIGTPRGKRQELQRNLGILGSKGTWRTGWHVGRRVHAEWAKADSKTWGKPIGVGSWRLPEQARLLGRTWVAAHQQPPKNHQNTLLVPARDKAGKVKSLRRSQDYGPALVAPHPAHSQKVMVVLLLTLALLSTGNNNEISVTVETFKVVTVAGTSIMYAK